MKALVTGAKGFVGRHMHRTLEDAGYWVDRVDLITGDNVFRWIPTCIRKYDLIVHAAAKGPNRKAIDTQPINFSYNTALDATMFEWAMRTRQPRFVYLSSSAVYTPQIQPHVEKPAYLMIPPDTYGMTKRHGELLAEDAQSTGMLVTVVRPFSGYGEDQSTEFPFRMFVERAKAKERPFTVWGNAEQLRDWIHIDDICAGIMALVEAEVGATTPINLCTGRSHTMKQLAIMCMREAGYESTIHVDHEAPMGVYCRRGDATKLQQFYTPKITLEEGVARAFR